MAQGIKPGSAAERRWVKKLFERIARPGRRDPLAKVADLERAEDRVGRTEEARARWLLGFAHRDLDGLSSGDQLNLRWEILAFSLPGLALVSDPGVFEVQAREFQARLREGLERLAAGGRGYWGVALKVPYRYYLSMGKGGLFGAAFPETMGAGGASEDWFMARACDTLVSQARRFRLCWECRRPFIARKRQAYCTTRCSQTFRTRKHRAKTRASRAEAVRGTRGKEAVR